MTSPKCASVWSEHNWKDPVKHSPAKGMLLPDFFFPVKKIALDLTGGVFGYIAKAIF